MKRSQAFPSKYLNKDDVETPVIATMRHVAHETMDEETGEVKPILFFEPPVKPLVLNNTNWMAIEDLFGDESDNWQGQRIELYQDPNVMFGKKRVGGIRIRRAPNGRSASGDAPAQANGHDELWERYIALTKRAAEAGLTVTPLTKDASRNEIIEAGKLLKAEVEAAGNF